MIVTVWRDRAFEWRHTKWAVTVAYPGGAVTEHFRTEDEAKATVPKSVTLVRTSPTSWRGELS